MVGGVILLRITIIVRLLRIGNIYITPNDKEEFIEFVKQKRVDEVKEINE
jgi:hypothetical protein